MVQICRIVSKDGAQVWNKNLGHLPNRDQICRMGNWILLFAVIMPRYLLDLLPGRKIDNDPWPIRLSLHDQRTERLHCDHQGFQLKFKAA
jgi:hypothetical protein